MGAKTNPINTLNPPGDSDPKQGDDHIRTLAKALIELLTVDHYVGVANPWGSDASGDETGEHAKVMFHEAISDPSVDAGKGVLFIKGTPPELYFRDEDDGNVIQLTNGGIVNLTSAALLGILAKDTYFTAVNNAEDGTVNLIKAGTNDLATLPDSAEMASNAAPVEDEAIANKKYVDDNVGSANYSPTSMSGWSGEGAKKLVMPNGLIRYFGYTARIADETTIDISGASFSAVFHAQVTLKHTANTTRYAVSVKTLSTTSLVVHCASGGITGYYWEVLGK